MLKRIKKEVVAMVIRSRRDYPRQALGFILIALLTAFAPLRGAAQAAVKLLLAEGGQARAAIVVKDDRTALGLAAVLESHLAQMTGAHLPLLKTKNLERAQVRQGRFNPRLAKLDKQIVNFIFIGESDWTRALGVTTEGLGAGGIRIRATGNALVLLGVADGAKSPGGDAYAIYQFLERLGCRYLWPGESGKVVPKRDRLEVGPLDVACTPQLGQRHIRATSDDKIPNFEAGLELVGVSAADYRAARDKASATLAPGDWHEWQCLGGDLGLSGGHNGAGLGQDGWEKYGKSHPEWFALQGDGTRDQSGAKDRWRECVTAPGLIECVSGKIIEGLKRRPLPIVSLSPNDGGYASFCMCEACKKLDPPEAPKVKLAIFAKAGQSKRKTIEYPSLSDRFVWYWNQVAGRVTKEFPNQLLLVDAYSHFATPPVREKLHPNLVVRYVPSDTAGWTGWQQAGARKIYWRPNILYFGASEGTFNTFTAREMAEKMNYLVDHAMVGTDMDCILDDWAAMGVAYYASARLNWNPRLKYEEILEDYCRSGFGAAAEAMKRFYGRVDALRDPISKDLGNARLAHYTPQATAELTALLDEAAKAAGADRAAGERIAFVRAGWDFTAITAQAWALRNAAAAGRPYDRAAAAELMARRKAMMRELALKWPLAVNVPYVAGNEAYLWRPLK